MMDIDFFDYTVVYEHDIVSPPLFRRNEKIMRILGIDPGSRCTGYGVISNERNQIRWITHGQITTTGDDMPMRLIQIYQELCSVIVSYEPQEVAIEQVFIQKNVQTALKLGQARGAAIVAAAAHGLPIAEYSPRKIKQAVVGYGAASKVQVQHMMRSLLRLTQAPPSDAADALAIAICHSNGQRLNRKLADAAVIA